LIFAGQGGDGGSIPLTRSEFKLNLLFIFYPASAKIIKMKPIIGLALIAITLWAAFYLYANLSPNLEARSTGSSSALENTSR
jgi:hypothetical protein